LQQQFALLQGVNEVLKRKETELTAQVAHLEKAARDAAAAHGEAEIKAEKARGDIKTLTLGVEQLKQSQRVLETRAQRAESELEAFKVCVAFSFSPFSFLTRIKASQSSAAEGAVLAENVMATECKRLRSELDRAANLHEATLSKLQLELQEAREERDGALDMLAAQSLDAETELSKASTALRHENEALKQSVAALELKVFESFLCSLV
jgi:hypothetical protein